MKKSRYILPVFLLLFSSATIFAENYVRPIQPKFLQYGWEMTDNQELAKKYRQMEAAMPFFDGVIFKLVGQAPHGKISTLYPWSKHGIWKEEYFAEAIKELKSCKFTRFKDNFIMMWTSPGPIDWFDDQGWKIIAEKFRIVAKVAKAAGVKGICFDPETYGKFLWTYDPACGHSVSEVSNAARKRGQQIMRAMAKEFPDMTFMSFWLWSLPEAQKDIDMQWHFWGVYPSFINGLWDEVPAEMTVVDAAESGYSITSEMQAQLTAAAVLSGNFPKFAPKNRERYNRQNRLGWGIYLDPYMPGHPSWIVHNGTELAQLRRNVGYLMRTSAKYIWVYGEKGRWIASSDPKVSKPWESRLPGITNTFMFMRNPLESEHTTSENLVHNPELKKNYTPPKKRLKNPDSWGKSTVFPGYSIWYSGVPLKAGITADKNGNIGFIEKEGKNGSRRSAVSATVPISQANSTYLYEIEVKSQGECNFDANACFFTSKGGWLQTVPMVRVPGESADGFIRFRVIATAPDTAASTSLMFFAYFNNAGKGFFRNMKIIKLTAKEPRKK